MAEFFFQATSGLNLFKDHREVFTFIFFFKENENSNSVRKYSQCEYNIADCTRWKFSELCSEKDKLIEKPNCKIR